MAWVLALAVAAFITTLAAKDFILDDRLLIVDHFLLEHWRSLPELLLSGYWEGAQGSAATVAQLRPATMLSHFLARQIFGLWAPGHHALNVALHAVNAGLLFRLAERERGRGFALACAGLFAVLPAHSEAVGWISGRSELLAACFFLGSWLALDREDASAGRGAALFALALLSKEHALALPALLWLKDRSSSRRWRDRAALYGWLAAVAAAYIAARLLILDRPFHGGADYFAGLSALVRWLTMARFALRYYAWPLVSGGGLREDFSRPFFPDASVSDPLAWLSLAILLGLAVWSVLLLRRRRFLGFALAASALLMLPVSHLVVHLDRVGAQRFLYLPSTLFCAGLAWGLQRLEPRWSRAALLVLLGYYLVLTTRHNAVWGSERAYFESAVAQNPVSAGAHNGLGLARLSEGRRDEALALFRRSAALDEAYPQAHYNLGRMAFDEGRLAAARAHLGEALRRAPHDSDTLVMLALIDERQGRLPEAEAGYRRALELRPWDGRAHFNLGRLLWAQGRRQPAAEHLERFLRLSPRDPDAPAIAALLRRDS
ncbi:MAG: tetratricopeptide repeat protein [Elusimicrobia bacterium]|nr:tetratricopeptide repeat protein [Elusimicrobiota bacterium]